jgi:hypothetical protein
MRKTFTSFLLVLLAVAIGIPPLCFAEPKEREAPNLPLWEYGIIGMAARLPYYPGSKAYLNYVLPLPYLIYRGRIIKANENGLRGIFWRSSKFETDISLSWNPPVSSNHTAREGMPDLDTIVEMGPALRYYFYKYNEGNSCYLQADLRMAVSVGFDSGINTNRQGYASELALVYKDSRTLAKYHSFFNLSIGLEFSDSALDSYFYDVSRQYETADRPAYKAHGGYSGVQLAGVFVKRLSSKISLRLYGKYINLAGASFDNSPLVETKNNYVMACILSYKLDESKRMAE